MSGVALAEVGLPALEASDARPTLSPSEYEGRLAALAGAAGVDRVIVYGDREHFANLAFFCGFDPRFEEALLVVGGNGLPVLLVGNEGLMYASLVPVDVDVVLCPSLSLMGQDRSGGPRLADALRDTGVTAGSSVGLVGWKAFEPDEWDADVAALAVPAFVVDTARHLVGPDGAVIDVTPVVMNPVDGLRASSGADQIAAFEWAAARASRAVFRIVSAAAVGVSEQEAVRAMGYEGEPLSAHVMFSSGPEIAVGLRSPTARALEHGDGATTAVGFWGGLSCRAGLVAQAGAAGADAYLNRLAIPYWQAIASWYETVRIGVTGATVDERIRETLAPHGFGPALNPGHLTHLDEWMHSPIRPGSTDRVRSGMVVQCDVIPDCTRPGFAANCEDTVAVADETLRAELAERHPDVARRIEGRRRLLRDHLGVDAAPEILPLSCIPAFFPPFWLSPGHVLAREG